MEKDTFLIFCPLCGVTKNVLIWSLTSKHLKGRFGPRVSDGHVFAPKEVGLGPVLLTVTFLHHPGPTIQSRPCRP